MNEISQRLLALRPQNTFPDPHWHVIYTTKQLHSTVHNESEMSFGLPEGEQIPQGMRNMNFFDGKL